MKKWFSLENFVYLIIFLLPSYLIKLSIFGLPTNVLEVLIIVALGWAILKRSFRKILKLRFRIAVGMIISGLIISILVNHNYLVGIGIVKGWFVLPIILALIVKNVVPEEKKDNVYQAIYFSGFAVAAAGLQNYLAGITTFDGRLQGIFNSPNYLAMYLAPAIIVGWLFQKEMKRGNFWYVACYVISYITIVAAFYLTYSYAAWISIMLSLAIVVIIKNYKTLKNCKFLRTLDFTHLMKGILIVGLVGLIALSQWNTQKFQDLANVSPRSSLESRLMIWRSAEKMIADNWAWGIGPGNFQVRYLEYQKYFPAYLDWAVPHPHNVFLAFWLYAGLFGLIGFGLLVYFWFKEIIKKEQTFVWFVSLGIMLFFLIHGLVDTTYFKNDLAGIFWINLLVLL